MAINILTRAEVQNSSDSVGLTQCEMNYQDLQRVAGIRTGTITVPSLQYVCFEANIKNPFYCKDFTMEVSDDLSVCYSYFQATPDGFWREMPVTKNNSVFMVDFNRTLPDQAQLIYKFKLTYVNLGNTDSYINTCSLLTVDYPIDFDFSEFSIVATSRDNAPLKIYNNSVDQADKDIRVLPIFSNDYAQDCVYILTASGRSDSDVYHIQRGYRIPEDAPWDSGRISKVEVTTVSGKAVDGAYNLGTESIVPVMTGTSSPSSCTVIQSHYYTTNYGWKAFDGNDSTCWDSNSTYGFPCWVGVKFEESKLINKYRFKSADSYKPMSWSFQASCDNATWVTFDNISSPTYSGGWSSWYTFVNEHFYPYYRLYIKSIDGGSGLGAEIFNLVMVEAEEEPGSLISEGTSLTLSGTVTSGTWTSPVLYIPDSDYITMYVYGEDLGDDSFIERDFRKASSLVEVRTSDDSPLPNFLISNWTQRLFRAESDDATLKLPSRRAESVGAQTTQSTTSSYWYPSVGKVPVCGDPSTAVITTRPFILGRSKRFYVKGDGTIIAESPIETDESTMWEYAHRDYKVGYPYKEFGDINGYWNAGQFINLLGSFIPNVTGACSIVKHKAAPTRWHRMTFASESDQTNWASGKSIAGTFGTIMPYVYHFMEYNLGIAQEPFSFEPFGSYTFAVDRHPNEWVVLSAIVYPGASSKSYLCLYYVHVRNYWVSDIKCLGMYGIGIYPCDEGWAACKCSDGFWSHIGYITRTVDKYDINGDLIKSNRVNYSFNALRETVDPDGLWAIRNDAVYWFSVDYGGNLTEEFSISNSGFKYLQVGDVDSYNNLWLVDRDSSTVYRINFESREIDYEEELPYVVGVWPHPRDGSAFLYSSFNDDTFSTSVDRVWVDDPYAYRETLFSLPEFPLSDSTGVQFMGRSVSSFLSPSLEDPVWGTNDNVTLEWQTYPNASLALPRGKYKQFRITLRRNDEDVTSPKLSKVRIPKSLVLPNVPYGDYKNVYINPHLRYNKERGHFSTELVVWWPH